VELAELKREILLVEDQPMPNVPRLWFECPTCQRRCRHLFLPQVQCRSCLKLDYRCRHDRRWRRGSVAKVAWLRRLLGADERPFTELPRPGKRRARYWRLVKQIAEEEKRLLDGIRRFAEAAEKEARQ